MADYINRHKRRINNQSKNVGEAYTNNTLSYIESAFEASPTFQVLKVESTEFPNIKEIDARVIEVERMGSLRELLFRPKQYLNIGTYVEFDNKTWIVSDVWGENDFLVKALIQKCNQKLRFALYDNWKDVNGELDRTKIYEIHCVSSQSPLGSKAVQGKADILFNSYDVSLATSQLFVYLEKNEVTKTIGLNKRLIFGSNVYEVYGVDDASLTNDDGYGIIQLTVRLTTKRDEDDFVNKIAVNKTDEDYSDDSDDSDDTGGRIW